MPTRALLLVDDTALAAPGFVELARAELRDAVGGRFLVLPHLAVARSARGPVGRQALDEVARALVGAGRGRVLGGNAATDVRASLDRAIRGAAARHVDPAVLTQDDGYAEELRQRFPAIGLERLDGSTAVRWFAAPVAASPPPAASPFAPATSAEPFDDATLAERSQPAPGLALGGMHSGSRLGRLIGQGGEGWVYELLLPGMSKPFADLVCKVPKRPSPVRRRKLERMCVVHTVEGVTWPRALLFDAGGEWLGFTMPRASGKSVARVLRDVMDGGDSRALDRLALATLAARIVDRVTSVHALGALVGDVQPRNLVVGRGRQVMLLDADSFQVERFACPVGVVDYLHPDLIDRNLRTTLRTAAHEAFAVAVLTFNVLMCGFHPYAHKGGSTPLENQRKRSFPYLARGVRPEVPGGEQGVVAWLWSELEPELRAAFVASFEGLAPPAVAAWRPMIDRYAKGIRGGQFAKAVHP